LQRDAELLGEAVLRAARDFGSASLSEYRPDGILEGRRKAYLVKAVSPFDQGAITGSRRARS